MWGLRQPVVIRICHGDTRDVGTSLNHQQPPRLTRNYFQDLWNFAVDAFLHREIVHCTIIAHADASVIVVEADSRRDKLLKRGPNYRNSPSLLERQYTSCSRTICDETRLPGARCIESWQELTLPAPQGN